MLKIYFSFVSDLLYRQTVTINNTPLEVEIVDVSGETVSILLSLSVFFFFRYMDLSICFDVPA